MDHKHNTLGILGTYKPAHSNCFTVWYTFEMKLSALQCLTISSNNVSWDLVTFHKNKNYGNQLLSLVMHAKLQVSRACTYFCRFVRWKSDLNSNSDET